MRFALLSDIHGNLEALDAVLQACRREEVQHYFCLGDIVGYGADPAACIKRLRDVNATVVAGNHDWAVAGKIDAQQFTEDAQAGILYSQRVLSEEDILFLTNLPLIHETADCVLTHAMLYHPEEFDYILDKASAEKTFRLTRKPFCFVGHTHKVQVWRKNADGITCPQELTVTAGKGIQFIINTGSVGQPRDGDPDAAFAVFDTHRKQCSLKRVAYDIETAQKKIVQAQLPVSLAKRLARGV